MQDSIQTSFVLSIACLAFVGLCSIRPVQHAGQRLLSRKPEYKPITDHYEDEDGAATEASEAAYSDFVQRLLLVLTSSVATLVALGSATLTTNNQTLSLVIESWLQFATWTFISVQTWIIFTTPKSVDRFDLGIWCGASALFLAVAIPVEDFSLWFAKSYPTPIKIHSILSIVQFGAALIVSFTGVLIPRRPDVYLHDKLVDRQRTTSFLGRFTFSWPTTILSFAAKNRSLKIDDLPVMENSVRASTLRERFESKSHIRSIWLRIIRCHMGTFIAQWVLQVLTAVTNFLPQIVLYYTLRLLEARDHGADNQLSLWLIAIVMGVIDGVSMWLESLLFYIVFMKIAVPVYEQLSAVVFSKAVRRKDVKGATKGMDDDDALETKSTQEESNEKEEDGEEVAKTKQSTINLLGIDSKRVADFLAYSYLFAGSAIKLLVALSFLVKLIGWIPVLSGLAVPLVLSPLNWSISKAYAEAQDSVMKIRDQKMAVVTEALQGIRQIKFSALENDWYDKIDQVRQKELKQQWRVFVYDTALISNWIFGPACLSAISLTVYAIRSGSLSASIAFTTISVFEGLEVTLGVIPELITDLLDAVVSARRIQDYLDSGERVETTIPGESITFNDATTAWPSDNHDEEENLFRLHDIDLKFENKSLNVVSGRTGSGKSLLLACIIGEADILAGKVTVPRPPPVAQRFDHKANKSNWILEGAIAYVSQIPWIENASLRDNILFGLPFDQTRYDKVIHACALEKDLEMLTDGDKTDIGANGINLSGGQKWRTSFARALYSRAEILILDDIFSAVDAHVGRHLYEEALTGELCKDRTRILVTHHVALTLPKTKYSVLLENGRVLQAGPTEELRRTGLLKDILAHDVAEQQKEEETADQENAVVVDDGGHLMRTATNQSGKSRRISALSDVNHDLGKSRSRASESEATNKRSPPKKFVEEENRETGRIKLSIYKEYIKASGGVSYWSLVALFFGAWVVGYIGRSYWVSKWTRQYSTESEPQLMIFRQTVAHSMHHLKNRLSVVEVDSNLIFFVGIYVAISMFDWIIGTIRYFSIFLASIRASKVLFEGLTRTILRAPLRFLDQTPVGRILNRFTTDFFMIDSRVSYDVGFMLHSGITCLAVVIAGLFVSPFMIIFAILLMASSWYFASHYLSGAREIKRLESNAKSPIFEQFGSVLTGIGTIRAFQKSDVYIDRMFEKINTHAQAYWYMWIFNRWMSFRLNMTGAGFTFATAALIVSLKSIDASLAGFALSFSLQLAESVIWALRQYANVELDLNAVERIVEYSNLPTETQGGVDAPAAWPTEGRLEVNDLVVSYAPELPPVLKGLTFSVEQNERIGVVGRTGAGKSSLTLALFRFLEARSGSIYIDGIDISKIKLYDLRSRLAIIPQDPVLFSGTVRSNLDPFNQHSDTELRDALARVHLVSSTSASAVASGAATPTVQPSGDAVTAQENLNIFKSLSSPISEAGLNLSQGQRQLLCLARAIVSRPKIMVLDEATSSVDMDTDALIQESIRTEFGRKSTLIVIAHRLSTIADFDRILVLGEGKVEEFDTPRNLMQKSKSVFKEMVESSGEKAVLEKVIFGEKDTGGESSAS